MLEALEKIAVAAFIPGVAYASVLSEKGNKQAFISTSLAVGKKNAKAGDEPANKVDADTQFPASSLSKIVFTYLVLQLVKEKIINLDEPLHQTLKYKRFLVEGVYPDKAFQLTARHVLSHTTGLPNWGENLEAPLFFNPQSKLGEGYSYSGEAFFYLQQVLEAKTGRDLETLAKTYVFQPLEMLHSSFLPPENHNSNVVTVHTELGEPKPIYVGNPPANAAGSLLTTAKDYAKFMMSWLTKMDDPLIQLAFQPRHANAFPTCGLGWHLYRNEAGKLIAYQYGENPNTRAFIALDVEDRKAAVYFSNSELGMSIAHQVLSTDELCPIVDMRPVFKHLNYHQSDEAGWRETIEGKIAEAQDECAKARSCFEQALALAPHDESMKQRLKWFHAVQHSLAEKPIFSQSIPSFKGIFRNPYNDEIEISVQEQGLIFKQFGHEIKLVRVTEMDFVPERDQAFRLSFHGNQMRMLYLNGQEKALERCSSYAAMSKLLSYKVQSVEEINTSHKVLDVNKEPEKEEKSEASNLNEAVHHSLKL